MELKVVEMSKVWEDECNPRSDFGDLEALARSFGLNPMRPGEPMQPPLLVADGDAGFRVVDGARRVRAMRLINTQRFAAVVCDGLDEAESALAMLSTDDKKQLGEGERSRGVQRALLFGIAPERVDRAARVSGSARVRRAMARVGEGKARQMSLDRLLAIEEFVEEFGHEPAGAVAAGERDDWQRALEDDRRAERQKEAHESMSRACELAGLECVDEGPDARARTSGLRYAGATNDPVAVAGEAERLGARLAVLVRPAGSDRVRVELWSPAGDQGEGGDGRDEEAGRHADELIEAVDGILDALWGMAVDAARVGERLDAFSLAVADFVGTVDSDWSEATKLVRELSARRADAEGVGRGTATGTLALCLLRRYAEFSRPSRWALVRALTGDRADVVPNARRFVALAESAIDDGLALDDAQLAAVEELCEIACDDDDDDE